MSFQIFLSRMVKIIFCFTYLKYFWFEYDRVTRLRKLNKRQKYFSQSRRKPGSSNSLRSPRTMPLRASSQSTHSKRWSHGNKGWKPFRSTRLQPSMTTWLSREPAVVHNIRLTKFAGNKPINTLTIKIVPPFTIQMETWLKASVDQKPVSLSFKEVNKWLIHSLMIPNARQRRSKG